MSDSIQPQWNEVESALRTLLDLPAAEQALALEGLAAEAPALHAEVLSLLPIATGDSELAIDAPVLTAPAAVPEPPLSNMELGAWQLGDLIGRGGMGEVYRCERADGVFSKTAAAKVLRPEALKHLERFEAERNIVAQLEHPGITRLLDGGLLGERPYMVMEYVNGVPLNDYARGHALNLDALLNLFAQICDAVAYAHSQGVIHRDLKPGNILVTPDGRPKLLDFGIAKLTEQVTTQTSITQAPMTVAYSAPEQLQGKKPTPATDVHALGLLLYELLTGQLPWQSLDNLAISVVMQSVLKDIPAPASVTAQQNPNAPVPPGLLSGDLEAILSRALQKDPSQRFASVDELAADLARFRRGDAITARTTTQLLRPQQDIAERRQISVMFCDLVGSTALSDELDPEDFRALIVAYQDALGAVVDRYQGHVAQYLGDGALIYFGYPERRDDDAERAVRCGYDILHALKQLNYQPPLQARIGIHTGPVVVGQTGGSGNQQTLAMGATTNLAARLQSVAETHTVVISPVTLKLVTGLFITKALGEHELKGIEEPMPVYQVVQPSGVRTRLEAADNLTLFVGREQELALLQDRWERSTEGDGQAVLITAEPGIGKSRLLLAFRESLHGQAFTWHECRCAALNRNSAFAPIIELLEAGLQLRPEDSREERLQRTEQALEAAGLDLLENIPLLAPLLDFPIREPYARSPYGPELKRKKTLALLGDWLLALSSTQPLLLAIEDLHWADPSTNDVVGQILAQLDGANLMLVMTTRPEFKPGWDLNAIKLQSLRPKDSQAMLTALTENRAFAPNVITSIIQRTGGVPLFLEELVQHLIDTKQTADALTTQDIPATLQDSLAARIDRLGPAKSLLQLCAVVGRETRYVLLPHISDLDEPSLQNQLAQLVDSQLLSRHGQGAEARYQFKHALIQDSAYNALLNKTRKRLHQRIADALAQHFPKQAENEPAVLAEHLAAAGQAEQALDYFIEAAELGERRASLPQTVALVDRALVYVPQCPEGNERDTTELTLLMLAIRALGFLHGYGTPKVLPYFERAHLLIDTCRDVDVAGVYYALWWSYQYFGGHPRSLETALQGIEFAEKHDSPQFRCHCGFQAGASFWRMGKIHDALAYSEEAIAAYDPIIGKPIAVATLFDPYLVAKINRAGFLALFGHVDQAREALAESHAFAEQLNTPMMEGLYYTYSTYPLVIMSESAEELLEYSRLAEDICSRYGYQEGLDWSMASHAMGLLLCKRYDEARVKLKEYLDATSNHSALVRSVIFVSLAEACFYSGHAEEAWAAVEKSIDISNNREEKFWLPEAYRIKALLTLRLNNDLAEAESLYLQSIQLSREMDSGTFLLKGSMDLAELYQQQGRVDEARGILTPAYQALTEGLDKPLQQRAKAILDSLRPPGLSLEKLKDGLRQGRWQRVTALVSLGAGIVGGRVVHGIRQLFRSRAQRQLMTAKLRSQEAQKLAGTLGNMKGVGMKVAQIVSFTADGLNPDMRAALESLQADAPAMEFDLVRDIIAAELGGDLNTHFKVFDEAPVAAASIGQVHRAILHNGSEVAVKVQFPGLAQAIESDLANTAALTRLAKLVMPSMGGEKVVQELRERLQEELDYEFEACNQQLFFDLYDGHPSIRAPKVFAEFSSKRVLTMEFIRGRSLQAIATAESALKAQVAESIFRFALEPSIRFMVFNGDPHPGNYLVDDDGKLCCLDFGCTKFWPVPINDGWMKLMHAMRVNSQEYAQKPLQELGFFADRAGMNWRLAYEWFRELNGPYRSHGEYHFSSDETARIMRLAIQPTGHYKPLRKYMDVPKELVLIYRFLFGLNSVMTSLDAKGPWRNILGEYIYRDAPATELGEQERAFRQKWCAERGLNPERFYQLTHDGFKERPDPEYMDMPRT